MAHHYSYKQIGNIAYPILISALMEQLIGTTDTAYLGRVGEVELGASALGGVFFTVVFMLGLGFSVGSQILMARRNGEGNYERIGGIFFHSVAFLLVLALLLFVGTRLLAPYIMEHTIHSVRVLRATESYLHWRVYGFFFAFVNLMFRSFYVATTHTRTLTLNSVVMVLSNIVLNYMLIFGHFGCPALGIAGAAMGSCMAEAVSTVFFVVYTCRSIDLRKYSLNVLPTLKLSIIRSIFNISVWTMVQNFLSLATWFIFFISIEHLGESALAATNIIRNISAFTFMTIIAFASTASTLVGNLMGQGEAESVWPMLKQVIRMTYLVMCPIVLLIAIFPDLIMSVFTTNGHLHEVARGALYVLLSSYVFAIPAQILLHAVSGTGSTRVALYMELFSLIIYTSYVVVVVYHYQLPLTWCWASEIVYSFFIFVTAMYYMKCGKWKTKQI